MRGNRECGILEACETDTLRKGFCDVELCKQVGKEGIWKIPSRLSGENNSDGLSKSYLSRVLR